MPLFLASIFHFEELNKLNRDHKMGSLAAGFATTCSSDMCATRAQSCVTTAPECANMMVRTQHQMQMDPWASITVPSEQVKLTTAPAGYV